ncbi:MAG: hypothetical protein K0V04_17735 [Deltaproteobacteria bacterium]|nr:hypothetical protein [Deltaproteobacteria bacterium]
MIAGLGLPAWWLARPLWSDAERRTVAWTALGSVGALIPLAAILPSTRALALAVLGPAVFVASISVAAARACRPSPASWRLRLRTLAVLGLGGLALHQHLWTDAAWARAQMSCVDFLSASICRCRGQRTYESGNSGHPASPRPHCCKR